MAQIFVQLTVCLIIATITEAGVLKSRQISLPPGAIVMEVTIRQKTNDTTPKTFSTMKIEIDGDNKKVTLIDAAAEMPPDKVLEFEKKPVLVPSIEDRSIFPKGNCPKGYVRRGSVCFPDDDA